MPDARRWWRDRCAWAPAAIATAFTVIAAVVATTTFASTAAAETVSSSATTTPTRSSASPVFCTPTPTRSVADQDRLLRFAAVVRQELEASGHTLALIARKGTNLARFGQRYSHAGIALAANPKAPWSVRQLYFACDEGRPRVYDEGIAGFVLGGDDPALSYVSLLLLPAQAAHALEHAALDDDLARSLLADRYSPNAYALATTYQNCNQWVIELIAQAWGARAPNAMAREEPRSAAQRWLAAQGYEPTPVAIGSHLLMLVAPLVPMVRFDDHPIDDLHALRVRTSLPASIESFVRTREPGTQRLEICHDTHRIVIRRGWEPLADGCKPGPDDRVVMLDR